MTNVARELWRVVEPFHQVAYRSAEATAAYEDLGLRPGPRQYFANRLAALGTVGPTTAAAVLYGFNPAYVASVVPDVWALTHPDAVCKARQEASRACLTRILPGLADAPLTSELATLARRLVKELDFAGSPLGGACLDQPYPDDREHRGDAHWRATAAHGIDPVQCHILHAADGAMPEDLLQRVSGWDDESWSKAKRSLAARGLVVVDDSGIRLTDDGHITKRAIEATTDAHAKSAIEVAGTSNVIRMREEMRPWIEAIMAADVIGAWKMREALWRDE